MGFLFSSSWKFITRIIKDPVAVGIRTDSAINPMVAISGITSCNAFAAPVVVRIMLFMMDLFFLKSLAPVFGSRSNTCCDPVAACTVAMDAERILSIPKYSIKGLIIWDRQVVVQDALEIISCFTGS